MKELDKTINKKFSRSDGSFVKKPVILPRPKAGKGRRITVARLWATTYTVV